MVNMIYKISNLKTYDLGIYYEKIEICSIKRSKNLRDKFA